MSALCGEIWNVQNGRIQHKGKAAVVEGDAFEDGKRSKAGTPLGNVSRAGTPSGSKPGSKAGTPLGSNAPSAANSGAEDGAANGLPMPVVKKKKLTRKQLKDREERRRLRKLRWLSSSTGEPREPDTDTGPSSSAASSCAELTGKGRRGRALMDVALACDIEGPSVGHAAVFDASQDRPVSSPPRVDRARACSVLLDERAGLDHQARHLEEDVGGGVRGELGRRVVRRRDLDNVGTDDVETLEASQDRPQLSSRPSAGLRCVDIDVNSSREEERTSGVPVAGAAEGSSTSMSMLR